MFIFLILSTYPSLLFTEVKSFNCLNWIDLEEFIEACKLCSLRFRKKTIFFFY